MKEIGKARYDCVAEFLRTVPAFLNLDDHVLYDIGKRLYKKYVPKGRMIYQRGDTVDALYILEAGRVEVYKSDDDARRLTLWYINPGEVFCIPTVMTGMAATDAETVKDSVIYCLSREDFHLMLERFPEIAVGFLKCVSGRIHEYSMSVDRAAFSTASARTADVLLRNAVSDSMGRLFCRLSRSEIVALTGLCRETVSRTLNRLNKEHLIEIRGKDILLLNIKGLQDKGSKRPDHRKKGEGDPFSLLTGGK